MILTAALRTLTALESRIRVRVIIRKRLRPAAVTLNLNQDIS
jgi:hypothetical protein